MVTVYKYLEPPVGLLETCGAPATARIGDTLERLAWMVRCYEGRNAVLRQWYADVKAAK